MEQDFRTPIPLDSVTISGPAAGIANTAYTFTATVSPPTATTPISYTWSPTPNSGQGTSSAGYTWATAGVKTISVTAANAGGAVSDTHTITITGLTVRVITYEYDALGRLVEAGYSTGERFEYAYDKVGNRLRYTQTITGTTVITYVYDAANRLTSVNGVGYDWDDNGNLISDGSRTYTYTQSNRLVAISGPGLEWSAVYNGDGARLRQMVNGVTTDYVQDLAAPLPVVLQAQYAFALSSTHRSTQYVFPSTSLRTGDMGTRPLAQYGGETWTYPLPDGLGSVRHETGASGNLLATRSFDPYGAPLEGDGGAPYGYTGEEYNGSTELVFLRARYYAPEVGVFLSRDPWMGDAQQPGTYNGFNYAMGNPINLSDPTGLKPPGLGYFLACFQLSVLSQFMPGDTGYENVTAQQAVDICKAAHDKENWEFVFHLGQDLPKTTWELFGWFVHEWRGKYKSNWLEFDASEPLTQDLAKSGLIADLRRDFYREGDLGPEHYKFRYEGFATAFLDYPWKITFFLGSFRYQVKAVGNDRVGFRIDNDTTLESGTHIANRFPDEYDENVETLIKRRPDLKNKPLYELIRNKDEYKLISILASRTTKETEGSQGGGNLYQTYTWTESRNCLWAYLLAPLGIDIQVWHNYASMTEDPPWPRR